MAVWNHIFRSCQQRLVLDDFRLSVACKANDGLLDMIVRLDAAVESVALLLKDLICRSGGRIDLLVHRS